LPWILISLWKKLGAENILAPVEHYGSGKKRISGIGVRRR
jgi:hypothetical protein